MKLAASNSQNKASYSSLLSRGLAIAFATVAICTPAIAESESGGFVFGGGNQSGGFLPIGTAAGGSESGGVLWGAGNSESGGALSTGAESDSGGTVEVGNNSESGGPLEVGSTDENKLIVKTYRW